MAGWLKKVRLLALVGVLAGGSITQPQAQAQGQQLPMGPTTADVYPHTAIRSYSSPAPLTPNQVNRPHSVTNPLPAGNNPLPTQVISQPDPNMPQEPLPAAPVFEGEIVTSGEELQNHTCETCSKPGAKWLIRHKIFQGKNGNSGDRYVSEGEGGHCGIFGPHCYSHHDDYYPCTTFWTEFCFVFGSCRNFYGNPCRQGPMPVPVPPGYSLPPGPYGYSTDSH